MTKSILAAAALALAAAALALGAFTGTASASDQPQSRAVSALSTAIASQGNAALLQIRRELKDSALQAIKPFLPQPAKAQDPAQPATTPSAQR